MYQAYNLAQFKNVLQSYGLEVDEVARAGSHLDLNNRKKQIDIS